MSEKQPSEEELSEVFETMARDFILRVMAQQGWANQSDGSVAAPMGWFARISNEPVHLESIYDAFWYETELLGPENRSKMLGHFVIQETDRKVKIKQYATEREAINKYSKLQHKFCKWLDANT